MGIRLTARRALSGYAVAMALLVAAHYTLPGLQTEVAGAIELGGAAAMAAGVARNRPRRRAPWLLLAVACFVGAAAELSLRVMTTVSHAPVPFPSFVDVVYLLVTPLVIAGLALFIGSGSSGRDLRGLVDALVLLIGLALLSWVYAVLPGAAAPSLTLAERALSVAYPVGDLVILVALVRLLMAGTAHGAAAALLTIGTAGALTASFAHDLIEFYGDLGMLPLLDLGEMTWYIAWGAAALHPSMTSLTGGPGEREPEVSRASMIVLLLAALIPPAFLFVWSFETRDGIDGVGAVACGVLFLLMLSRLWDVAASHRRGLIRERTLRMAGAALASAGSVEEVVDAVRKAAAALIPAVAVEHAAMVSVRDGDYLRRVQPGPPRLFPVGTLLKLTNGPLPTFVPAAELRAARQEAAAAASVPASVFEPPGLASYEGALCFPLILQDRPVGDPLIGLVAFYGARRTLHDAAAALEILAGQTTLAVERVTLTQEVVRQRGEALFRTLVQDASDVILIVGDDRRVRYATPSAAGIFGDVTAEGALVTDLVAPGAREDANRVLDLMLGLGASAVPRDVSPGYLLQVERLDGRVVVLEVRWSDLRDDSTVGGLVLTLRDVTEQHELEEELKYRAFHDALTGLPNRAYFAREAAGALEAARAARRTAGVLFVDLDDFKVVNDTMGHGVGDELLVVVAARLTASVRQSDTAARLGGDEFALLIDDAADPGAVDEFAERIVTAFAEPFTLSQATVLAAATVGVATSADSGDVDELLRHADLALYAAKAAGKRRWRHYQPALTSGMLKRREDQAALEDAVKNSAFTLLYQPIVFLASGEIAGFESLIRWPRPRGGTMQPDQFISLAEETGLIVPLGAWVLRQALSDAVRWRRRLPPRAAQEPGALVPESAGPHVSVNVSARQFRDPGFTDSVRRALHASSLPPSALLLELTESLLLGDNDRIRADLNELKEIGVKLAIDDFGTGYSSLSYLLELPIDVLKIDKKFVTGIASSGRQHALVEGIVRLAGTLEVQVIAEGIETETERELLAGMGCQFGQGYLLSVPVDSAAAAAMLHCGHGLVTGLPQQRGVTPDGRYLTDL